MQKLQPCSAFSSLNSIAFSEKSMLKTTTRLHQKRRMSPSGVRVNARSPAAPDVAVAIRHSSHRVAQIVFSSSRATSKHHRRSKRTQPMTRRTMSGCARISRAPILDRKGMTPLERDIGTSLRSM